MGFGKFLGGALKAPGKAVSAVAGSIGKVAGAMTPNMGGTPKPAAPASRPVTRSVTKGRR